MNDVAWKLKLLIKFGKTSYSLLCTPLPSHYCYLDNSTMSVLLPGYPGIRSLLLPGYTGTQSLLSPGYSGTRTPLLPGCPGTWSLLLPGYHVIEPSIVHNLVPGMTQLLIGTLM